jgi:DNA-binding transcriptional ArsR family regulator
MEYAGYLMNDSEAAALAQALGNPLRLAYLRALRSMGPGGKLSPSEFARGSGKPLGNVSYHVKALSRAGVLEVAERIPRRGAIENLYSFSGPQSTLTRALMDLLVEPESDDGVPGPSTPNPG